MMATNEKKILTEQTPVVYDEVSQPVESELPLLIRNAKNRHFSSRIFIGDPKSRPNYLGPDNESYLRLIKTTGVFDSYGLSLNVPGISGQSETEFYPLVVAREGEKPTEHPSLHTPKVINNNGRLLLAIPRLDQPSWETADIVNHSVDIYDLTGSSDLERIDKPLRELVSYILDKYTPESFSLDKDLSINAISEDLISQINRHRPENSDTIDGRIPQLISPNAQVGIGAFRITIDQKDFIDGTSRIEDFGLVSYTNPEQNQGKQPELLVKDASGQLNTILAVPYPVPDIFGEYSQYITAVNVPPISRFAALISDWEGRKSPSETDIDEYLKKAEKELKGIVSYDYKEILPQGTSIIAEIALRTGAFQHCIEVLERSITSKSEDSNFNVKTKIRKMLFRSDKWLGVGVIPQYVYAYISDAGYDTREWNIRHIDTHFTKANIIQNTAIYLGAFFSLPEYRREHFNNYLINYPHRTKNSSISERVGTRFPKWVRRIYWNSRDDFASFIAALKEGFVLFPSIKPRTYTEYLKKSGNTVANSIKAVEWITKTS